MSDDIIQQITVKADQETVTALKEMGYELYMLRAFQTTNAESEALVWIALNQYANQTSIPLSSSYLAFVAKDLVTDGAVQVMNAQTPVQLGDIATFGANHQFTVAGGGMAGTVTVRNAGTDPYYGGLAAEGLDGTFQPMASAPLYGMAEDIFAPLDKYLVTFSTGGIPVGAALPFSVSQSVLVDFTGQTYLTVTFDINTGWSFAEGVPAQIVGTGVPLFPVVGEVTPMTEDA